MRRERMSREAWRLVLHAAARGLDEWQAELDDEQNADRYADQVPDEVRARWHWREVELRRARAAFSLLWERHCS